MPYCNNDPCETEAVKFYRTEEGVVFYLCNTCAEAFELGQVNPNIDLAGIEDLGDEPDADEDIRNWIKFYVEQGHLDKTKPVVVGWGGSDPDIHFVWIETERGRGVELPDSFTVVEEADAWAQRVEGALLDLEFQVLQEWPNV